MMNKRMILLALLISFQFYGNAQYTGKPQRFDFGKMWTFEHPPKEWFNEAYKFTPDDKWFDDVRKSALRFASWCSASFVSPNGLIMTNHHCSRDVVTPLQKEGENFEKNGFYATTLADERKAEGLFVEQLIIVEDISDRVLNKMNKAKDDTERKVFQDSALAQVIRDYQMKDSWKDLRLQSVTFYSGGRFSLYGYKKFSDIRLVLIPETDLGFFGGDPDNFTYPRYDLDCTFWRAYDDNGNPLNTAANYFKFKPEGAEENEPVFVVGNPGNTERYRTTKQLEYDRDIRFPTQIELLTNRRDMMQREYDKKPNIDLLNDIFGLSNSIKAFTGIEKGLRTPELMMRKKAMEEEIRSKTKLKGEDYWTELESSFVTLRKYGAAVTLAGPSPIKGNAVNLMFALSKYEQALKMAEHNAGMEKIKEEIKLLSENLNSEKEQEYLKLYLEENKKFEHPEFKYIDAVLDGKTPEKAAKKMLDKTDFAEKDKLEKIFKKDAAAFAKIDDPLLDASRIIVPKYQEAVTAFQSSTPKRRALESRIVNSVFNVKGTNLPPDATFTLRLADGVVKGYDYNGTVAPYKTTFYGMYDRYYSFNKKYPWALPARWENPPMEFLKAPVCIVSTNDIIGGNSGSPLINKNKEAVGLIFDGNIESLPGNFIYDESLNRTVSVHAGGIFAALKYIYKADRLVNELTGK
jgi:hypothetical protein